ncbi:MAG: hypothetical protein K9W45_09315 [Candidatus Heimdallarchaeum aukensis]|uniref:Uncharacterized protein n=1 Tax=Candidatus Heimdallarchaeum aukensis TaxID=2876573 RepID=A0A9Y1BJ54_9ARCH|nr:MAG: hypothetical protein K9W45_09315 [Candidatus Heimdallarchaeum aukensis]
MLQGQERWNKIEELKKQGYTYSEIAPIIGLGSGKAVSVWVARNRNKYETGKKQPAKKRTERDKRFSQIHDKKQIYNFHEEEFEKGEILDISQFNNEDIETFLSSILNLCDVDVTKFHIHKDEENERWTVGILAELKSRNKTIFPYSVRIRTTAAIGKYLPELKDQEEIEKKRVIASKIKSVAQEVEILSAAMGESNTE